MRQTQNASKKDNRKSILVIGLLLLLVAVIGFGGYTLSKYVTKKTTTGSATVAKWGFTIETNNADKLFGSKYSAGKVTDNDTALTVKAENAVVAPGTSGSMTFTIGGKAEVKAKLAVEVTAGYTDVSLKYTRDASDTQVDYNPVKWTLMKGEEKVVDGKTLNDVATALAKINETVEAGAEIAAKGTYTLSWEWAFENNDNPDSDNLDTMLGMLSNGATFTDNKYVTEEATYTKVEANTTISFEFVIKVEQVNA